MSSVQERLSGSIVIFCMLALMLPISARAVTPSGTRIDAYVQADCQSTDGVPMPTEISNTASVNVTYPTGLSVGSAKRMDDEQFIQLVGTVVVGGTPELGGVFYIESPDRSTGIRVQTTQTVREGDLVIVSGTLATVSGERQINAVGVATMSSGNTLPRMLAPAPSRTNGLDNTGLLVRVYGRITAAPAGVGYFYVDDGSVRKDGSGYTGIRIYGTAPSNPVGKFVAITGIPGMESSAIRVIRTRRAGDILAIPGIP